MSFHELSICLSLRLAIFQYSLLSSLPTTGECYCILNNRQYPATTARLCSLLVGILTL